MERSYTVTLPAGVWEDFSHRLCHPPRDEPKGVDVFFRNVGVDVHVRHEDQTGFLISDGLDTAGILAAFSCDCSGCRQKENVSGGYQISLVTTIHVPYHGAEKEPNADENCYQARLREPLFYSMDTRNQLKTA